MLLDIWECLKWNDFALTINADQTSINKDNGRKADFYVYIGERSKALVVGSRFLDCVTVFTCSLNSEV